MSIDTQHARSLLRNSAALSTPRVPVLMHDGQSYWQLPGSGQRRGGVTEAPRQVQPLSPPARVQRGSMQRTPIRLEHLYSSRGTTHLQMSPSSSTKLLYYLEGRNRPSVTG